MKYFWNNFYSNLNRKVWRKSFWVPYVSCVLSTWPQQQSCPHAQQMVSQLPDAGSGVTMGHSEDRPGGTKPASCPALLGTDTPECWLSVLPGISVSLFLLVTSCPDWDWTCDSPASASQSARVTGMCHHTLLILHFWLVVFKLGKPIL